MECYVGIDFGTTHVKAGLFDEAGRQLALERVPTPTRNDSVGSVYDPAEIAATLQTLLTALHPRSKPAGIVVTGMAEAGILLHRERGEALSAMLPWFDRRTAPLAAALPEETAAARFYETGLRNSFKYGIYKYRWCLAHSDVPAAETVWLSAVDYVVYLLTGACVTDPSFAARTYAYDINREEFDLPWLEQFGLERENFPAVLPSGSVAGACRLAGWEDIPVYIGAHDHLCAAFGMSLVEDRAVFNSCGTAETYLGAMAPRPLTEEDYRTGYVFGPFPDGRRFWMANISASGLSMEWYRERVQLKALSYEEIDRRLRSDPAPSGILYFPALTGMGTPCFRQDFPAAFLGMGPSHTGDDLLRAVVEGIALQGRMILAPVLAGRQTAPTVLSVGGATESGGWMQRKADVLGLTVQTLSQKEATLTGAVALMLWRNRGETAARTFYSGLQGGVSYPADPARHQAYEEMYRRYCRWYAVLAEN